MLKKILITAVSIILISDVSHADTIEVKMLNKGEMGTMIFEPAFIKAMPGDTITFISTDNGHNVETVKGMLPEGASKFKSKLGDNFSVTLNIEGIYGVKCTPHYALGMVAVIQIGNAANYDTALNVKQKGKAKKRFSKLFKMIEM